MRTTPPPLCRRVAERAAATAEEVRVLVDRSADLLARIDDLCASTRPAGR